jgi:hypothetical protein
MSGVEAAHKIAMTKLKIGETAALTAIKARAERDKANRPPNGG